MTRPLLLYLALAWLAVPGIARADGAAEPAEAPPANCAATLKDVAEAVAKGTKHECTLTNAIDVKKTQLVELVPVEPPVPASPIKQAGGKHTIAPGAEGLAHLRSQPSTRLE